MLHLEREISELRRLEAERREGLEERISTLEDLARLREAEASEVQDRPGCLGRLLGY